MKKLFANAAALAPILIKMKKLSAAFAAAAKAAALRMGNALALLSRAAAALAAALPAAGALALLSCAALPPAAVPVAVAVPESPAELPPESAAVPEAAAVPEYPEALGRIMGEGTVPGDRLAAFLLQINDQVDEGFARDLAAYYVEEAAAEGVNHDTAFAQMCLETGFLRYGNLVTAEMNNFCGLGAIGPGEAGHSFPDPRAGVRAHIQHLQAYAADGPLNGELIDPRYHYVRRGSSPTIRGLAGTWAADRAYDAKIARILRNLFEFAEWGEGSRE